MGRHGAVGHRQDAHADVPGRGDLGGDLGERRPLRAAGRAVEVGRQIAVAEAEPCDRRLGRRPAAPRRSGRGRPSPSTSRRRGPSRARGSIAPASVYTTVSRSGEIASPLITASSAVLTTAVIDDGSTTWTAPARKRAAPTPPHSTVTARATESRLVDRHRASQPGDRFAAHVARAPSRRRRRAQLSGRRRHDRLPGVARRCSTSGRA